jgi:hypothetical protein
MPRAATFLFSLLALSYVGCADGEMRCRVGADCPSGLCLSSGVCALPQDAGMPDAVVIDRSDTNVLFDDTGVPVDSGVRVCAPNRDGIVSRDEVPLRPGLRATFRIGTNAMVSTAGTMTGGMRTWDFSGAYAGDMDELTTLMEPGANWWAAMYPTATHAARLSSSADNLGVFQITDDALLLLGVVSPEAGVTQTRLTYTPPVTVIAFPLQDGSTFTTTSSVSGTALGVIAAYTEEYNSVVDASGTLITPYGSTPALRVRTEMTRRSGLVTLTTLRQFTFVAECFGIAGLVTSNARESSIEFTTAAEIRRLAP